MKSRRDIVAPCGLFCGSCTVWYECHDDGGRFTGGADARPGGDTCNGCRSSHISRYCIDCDIRECAAGRGIESCSQCTELPCERLRAFEITCPHHHGVVSELKVLADIGEEPWVKRQEARWSCPSCGAPFSWYSRCCAKCGSAVPGLEEADGPDT